MDRTLLAALVLAFLVVVLALMLIGWRRRRARQRDLAEPDAVPAELGVVTWRTGGLHVATTTADDRLDRIAVRGLGFRARTDVVVAQSGIELDLHGERDVFVPRAAIRGADRSDATIDKGVEPGGLVRLRWTLGGTDLDTFLRVERPAELVDAIRGVAPSGADPDAPPSRPDTLPPSSDPPPSDTPPSDTPPSRPEGPDPA